MAPTGTGAGEHATTSQRVCNSWLNRADADAATLKKRTLTMLSNGRPTWLANAHATVDQAFWVAYGWREEPA